MFSIRDFWRRHRRKIFIGAGVLGGGYFLYTLYNSHRRRISDLERELAERQRYDELIKAQMQAHFENVQRIADTTTLPHAMRFLSERIEEELNLSHHTKMLVQGKGQQSTLSAAEKLEIWDRVKILSFTKLAVSLWSVTMLTLYIKVLVNILGRHLYIDTAREVGASVLLEDIDLNDDDLQNFLASADYLSNYSLPTLIADMQAATSEVLKRKSLRDTFDTMALHQAITLILSNFMNSGSAHHWVNYLMPKDAGSNKRSASSNMDNTISSSVTTFNQLVAETQAVLSGAEFGNIVDISMKAVADAVVEDIGSQIGGDGLSLGIPLAKLLPQIAKTTPLILEEPSQNRFMHIIRSTPEVDLFFTLLYTSMPSS